MKPNKPDAYWNLYLDYLTQLIPFEKKTVIRSHPPAKAEVHHGH